MSLKNFNEESEKPWFTYKQNPLVPHSWQIFEFRPQKDEYEPVGEYILIDTTEPIDITDKKLMNVMAVLNRKSSWVDFKNLTDKRVLFNIVEESPESDTMKVVFRAYDGSGVSKENAVLTIEKGVFHEKSIST
jgi:hypothetical protein